MFVKWLVAEVISEDGEEMILSEIVTIILLITQWPTVNQQESHKN